MVEEWWPDRRRGPEIGGKGAKQSLLEFFLYRLGTLHRARKVAATGVCPQLTKTKSNIINGRRDTWLAGARFTMDTGAAGHVMAVELLLHVKLECTCAPKKFVAACGEQIKDLGEQNIPFKSTERTPRGNRVL